MRIQERTVYFFNELSEEAQKKAVEEYNSGYDGNCKIDFVIDDFKEILKKIGYYNVKVFYSGFFSQCDGASFSASFRKNKNIMRNIKKEYPSDKDILEIVRQFKDIKLGEDYEIELHGRYYHENIMQCDNDKLLDLSKSLAVELYNRLKKEYYFVNSFNYIAEILEINEYEFLESGEMI